MSENIKSQNYRDLSEEEQETLAAGQITKMPVESNFSLQKANIQSMAKNTLNLENGDVYSQNTRYSSSQVTLASSIKLGLPKFTYFGNTINNFLANVLNNLFSYNSS